MHDPILASVSDSSEQRRCSVPRNYGRDRLPTRAISRLSNVCAETKWVKQVDNYSKPRAKVKSMLFLGYQPAISALEEMSIQIKWRSSVTHCPGVQSREQSYSKSAYNWHAADYRQSISMRLPNMSWLIGRQSASGKLGFWVNRIE